MKNIKEILQVFRWGMSGFKQTFFSHCKDHYGYIAPTASIKSPSWGPKQNVYIYEHSSINAFSKFVCSNGKFLLKKYCSVGPGLTVITFNHKYNELGLIPEGPDWGETIPADVIVEEYCWIGANVTLCPGSTIPRGCIVAAGSVVVRGGGYPPYSIIGGVPAKFIKFRLPLEKQIQQENILYPEKDRISIDVLKQNYTKYAK